MSHDSEYIWCRRATAQLAGSGFECRPEKVAGEARFTFRDRAGNEFPGRRHPDARRAYMAACVKVFRAIGNDMQHTCPVFWPTV